MKERIKRCSLRDYPWKCFVCGKPAFVLCSEGYLCKEDYLKRNQKIAAQNFIKVKE